MKHVSINIDLTDVNHGVEPDSRRHDLHDVHVCVLQVLVEREREGVQRRFGGAIVWYVRCGDHRQPRGDGHEEGGPALVLVVICVIVRLYARSGIHVH